MDITEKEYIYDAMALFRIIIKEVVVRQDDELLKKINCKLDKLLKGNNGNDDTAVIVKATNDLDTTGKELQTAIDKNTPKS